MKRPLTIILTGLIGSAVLAIGLYAATYFGVVPLGEAFNNFFIMVGIIIFLISGFFLLSLETLHS